MSDRETKHPGRLAQAVVAARIAVAVVAPLGGTTAPVPRQGDTETVHDPSASQQVMSREEQNLARNLEAAHRERRRGGLELGGELKEPDVVLDASKRSPEGHRR